MTANLPPNAIAVVGMALRVPGARTIDEYWQNLRQGVESIRSLTADELRIAGVDGDRIDDPGYVPAGAFLDGIDMWDPGFFGFNPREAAVMDPQHRLFLECAWEALELAGHRPDRFPGAIGVFAGSGMASYLWRNVLGHADLVRDTGFFLLRHTGNDKDFLATRVSYCFDLRGPSINVQTACSTSLVAIHMASQGLLNGECDLALAGGVTVEVPHRRGYVYREGEILSPDGHCRPFDAAAAGTVFGSGAVVVALRRLDDALASGDTIHAIVRGSAVNNDGAGKVGYLAPSVDGQAAAIAEALAVAGVSAGTIGMVEAHGTGTAVGDPIEVAALTQAFRQTSTSSGYCALGSVKSNLGHLDTAAGAAGFIKAVEALKHGVVPPTLHFREGHPEIDWKGSPFFVSAESVPWPVGTTPRRAGVSSLGVGGTNAHVVLEQAPETEPSGPNRGEQLLIVSGRTPAAAERRAADLATWLERNPTASLADAAFSLSAGRSEFRHRRFAVAADGEQAVNALLDADVAHAAADAGDGRRSVAFLFAGGGSQYAGMGAELYEREPAYREAFDACLDLARRHTHRDLRELVFATGAACAAATRELERPSLALPALFATQYALARLLMSWGIQPAGMIGHSMGEYTAACLAGVFELEDAMALVALRGRLFEVIEPGAMTSVPLPAAEVRSLLAGEASIAAENGPSLCVASGPIHAIEQLERSLAERGTECRRIHIDTAAHSSLLDPILAQFRAALEDVSLGEPTLPFISNLSGDWADAGLVANADYWVRHLRETVRFSQGLSRLFEREDTVLIEIGPGRTLTSLARSHPDRRPSLETVTTVPHPEDDTGGRTLLLNALGRLWQLGVEVDWDGFWATERRHRIPLPTYPFERSAHWLDPVAAAAPADGGEAQGEWFHTVRWDVSYAQPGELPERVLVFMDSGAIGEQVAALLRDRGVGVMTVQPGGAYTHDDARFTIDPDSSEHYDALLNATLARGRTGLIHLWNLDPCDDCTASLQAFDRPLRLLQALAAVDATRKVEVLFATKDAVAVTAAEQAQPMRALLAGPARVAPRELPHVRARMVDVAAGTTASARRRLATHLVTELAAATDDAIAVWRGAERRVEHFASVRLQPAVGGGLLRRGAVVLITGGTGGIGRVVARRLHEEAGAKLVLVGRRALPPRPSWDAVERADGPLASTIRFVREMEASGATVVVEAADVTDAEALATVVRRTIDRFGALDGVIHAAGLIDDRPIALKSLKAAERVLAPKVAGTLALDAAVEGMDLDFFILFSSRSAVLGAPGQVDYTAANAFLDSFAIQRTRRTGQPTVSIGWDAWKEVGMAAGLAGGAGWHEDPHPVLSRQRTSSGSLLLEGDLDPATSWVIAEHRVRDGDAVLPGSAYVDFARAAWIRDAGDGRVRIRDLMLLAPLAVNGVPRTVRVRLDSAPGGRSFSLLSRAAPGGRDWIVHARGSLEPLTDDVAARHDLGAIRSRCTNRRTFDGVVPHPHLAFGRRWSSLRSVAFGAGEALAELELPAEFAADLEGWALHPAMIDLATGAAQPLVPEYDAAADFYVPASYGSVRVFGALPARVISHIRYQPGGGSKDLAVFDVTVMDETGREIARFEEFTMVRIAGRAEVEHALSHAPVEPADDDEAWADARGPDLTHAISSADGTGMFMRLLAADTPSHIFVSPRTPAAWFAELDRPQPKSAPTPKRPTVELPDTGPVEEALVQHEAIAEAAVIAHPESHGRTRIIAFVVYRPGRRATVSELRRALRESVPEGLVPNSFIEMESLPKNVDGTPDRNALPNPFARADAHVAPRTPTELLIADIWKGLLGADRISVHDNFLDIGGHSLLGVRALLQIEKATSVRLSPTALTLQTLAQLAAECDRAGGNGGPMAEAAATADEAATAPRMTRRLLSAVRQALGGGDG